MQIPHQLLRFDARIVDVDGLHLHLVSFHYGHVQCIPVRLPLALNPKAIPLKRTWLAISAHPLRRHRSRKRSYRGTLLLRSGYVYKNRPQVMEKLPSRSFFN